MSSMNWDKFKNGKLGVRCRTHREADELEIRLYLLGLLRVRGDIILGTCFYDMLEDETVYIMNGENVHFYSGEPEDIEIVEYGDVFKTTLFGSINLTGGLV